MRSPYQTRMVAAIQMHVVRLYLRHLYAKALGSSVGANLTGAIRSVRNTGETAGLPANTAADFSPASYSLEFIAQGANRCVGQLRASTGPKGTFIISNLAATALQETLPDTTAALYGGLGWVEIAVKDARKYINIEPVGVIILAIDGLRQDVLYPDTMDGQSFENVNDPNGNAYYIDARTLPGLGQILKGDPQDSTTQHYVMLPEVTAIFPSITLASWASVFTGKMPSEPVYGSNGNIVGNNGTGILGNEFFARDLYNATTQNNQAVPGMHRLPSGMITLSDGAFSNSSVDFFVNNLLPVHDYAPTLQKKMDKSAPNKTLFPGARTVYEWINANVIGYKEPQKCMNGGECRSAVFFNHYARGADWWGTADLPWYYQLGITMNIADNIKDAFGTPERGSKTLDETPTQEAVNFLNKYYPEISSDNTGDPPQYNKSKRFPSLFTVYYGGPDHYAHDAGMDGSTPNYTGYVDYFKKKTDTQIARVVSKLKAVDEFDNKIFIVVADHGMTAMPTGLKYKDTSWLGNEVLKDAETSCKLKLDFVDPEFPDHITSAQKAERANNNLHIWELANLFTQFPSPVSGVSLKILAPKEIANITAITGATADIGTANIVAALNGPMAHIYIKGTDWQSDPDPQIFNMVLNRLYLDLKTGLTATGLKRELLNRYFPRLMNSIGDILVRKRTQTPTGIVDTYEVVTSISEDASGNLNVVTAAISDAIGDVDGLNRIKGMNTFNRSGDIILLMNDKTEGLATDRYTTGVACKSWHGSLNRSDSYVPLILSYPGGNKFELDPIIQKVCVNGQCEGNWKAKDLITEIIKTQYSGQ